MYIIIDALDECTTKPDLLKWIQSVTSTTSGKLHLMLASGRDQEIMYCLTAISGLQKAEIGDQSTAGDISAYIDFSLSKTDMWSDIEKQVIKDALLPLSGAT